MGSTRSDRTGSISDDETELAPGLGRERRVLYWAGKGRRPMTPRSRSPRWRRGRRGRRQRCARPQQSIQLVGPVGARELGGTGTAGPTGRRRQLGLGGRSLPGPASPPFPSPPDAPSRAAVTGGRRIARLDHHHHGTGGDDIRRPTLLRQVARGCCAEGPVARQPHGRHAARRARGPYVAQPVRTRK